MPPQGRQQVWPPPVELLPRPRLEYLSFPAHRRGMVGLSIATRVGDGVCTRAPLQHRQLWGPCPWLQVHSRPPPATPRAAWLGVSVASLSDWHMGPKVPVLLLYGHHVFLL